MGNFANKLLFYSNETRKESSKTQMVEQQTELENKDMCTPTFSERRILVDPRSVSAGIPRTPIEIKYTPISMSNKVPSAIPRYLQTKQYLETDMDVVMPPLTPKKRYAPKLTDTQLSDSDGMQDTLTPNINDKKHLKAFTIIDRERYNILGLDPRSPAADFDRTPILIPKSLAKLKARSQENLIRKGSYDIDIYSPKVLCQEINSAYGIPEIQSLPDTPLKHSEILNMEKYEEPDISSTFQSHSDSMTISKSEIEVTKNLKFEGFENREKELISNEQTIASEDDKEEDNMDKQNNYKDIEHTIGRICIEDISSSHAKQSLQDHDDKIKVWQDSSSLEKSESGKEEKKNIEKLSRQTNPREDIIITFDEHTSITLSKLVKTEENHQKKEEIREKKKKDIIDAKLVSSEENGFNKKENGNKYGSDTLKNRTPLGIRSNNEQTQKIATRSPQQLLKNKGLSNKVQQENTPPYKKYSANAKTDIQWDPNCTIFI